MDFTDEETDKLFNEIIQLEMMIDRAMGLNGSQETREVKLYKGIARIKWDKLSQYNNL